MPDAATAVHNLPPQPTPFIGRHDEETGNVRRVEVTVSRGVIREITFRIRQNTLRLGDLALLWGSPEVRSFGRGIFLFWRECGITALVMGLGRLSHLSPVWSVHFPADTGSPSCAPGIAEKSLVSYLRLSPARNRLALHHRRQRLLERHQRLVNLLLVDHQRRYPANRVLIRAARQQHQLAIQARLL